MIDYLKRKLTVFGGYRMDCDCASPPDYTSVANASKESAEIMAGLGRDQLAEARRQYDINFATLSPVIQAQISQMNQNQAQGADYYKYLQDTYRPVEQGLVNDATNFSTRGAQEGFARKAASDLERSQANELRQGERAMAAMGVNPNSGRFAGMNRSAGLMNAAARAGATTNARMQADNLGWAKRMDAAGLGRNLSNASAGAYGLATNAANSATNSQMGLGNQLLTGMNQGSATIGSGQQMQLQGLSSILGSQSNIYAADLANSGGGLGAVLGLAGQLGSAAIMSSDRRLKEDIEPVGVDQATGLNLYEFTYKDDPEQRRFRGVMADEVESKFPDAVVYDDLGFASVDYGMLGIQMVEV